MMESESVENDLEKKIFDVFNNNPSGVTQKVIEESIPSLKVVELVKILNKFIASDKIELLRKGQQLVYALKNKNAAKTPHGSDIEEKLIFDAIQRVGNNGISSKELKYACNLPQPQVTKILKALEAKRQIKCVTTPTKKKVFMLFKLEPSTSVTGGTFYSGQEFEAEFVNVLADQCYRYLVQAKGLADKLSDPISQRNASLKSSKDISNYINGLKISKVELKVPDIEKILDSLIYDAKIEKSTSLISNQSGAENLYRVTKPLVKNAGLMKMPCGVCLIFNECGKDRRVSPSTCLYMKEWLEF